MANLVFLPIEVQIKSGTYLLYGQEINSETYASCKSDMLLKGEGENADHIIGGTEWSTLAHDAFPAQEFDFMLANPPYGKSWKKNLEAMGGKDGIRDPRFKEGATKIGYEVSFTRHFYKPQPLRSLEEISVDILSIEKESEGLLDGLLKGGV
jgi:type I restriction-modification system DNA methylase subunit